MKNFYTILLSLTILFVNSGCGKSNDNKPTLPPATQIGTNTMGAMVDGHLFVKSGLRVCSFEYMNDCLECRYSPTTGALQIEGSYNDKESFDDKEYTDINLLMARSKGIFGIGTYRFGDYHFSYPYNVAIVNNSYYSTEMKGGSITITHLDTAKKIISGNFEFTAYKSNGDSTVVKDGRFDFNYLVN